jgi:hypothetical protein
MRSRLARVIDAGDAEDLRIVMSGQGGARALKASPDELPENTLQRIL